MLNDLFSLATDEIYVCGFNCNVFAKGPGFLEIAWL